MEELGHKLILSGTILFASQIHDSPSLAGRSLDFAWFADRDVDTHADRVADIRGEQPALSVACNLIGVACPCFGQDAHAVETLVAAEFDLKMRTEAFATQYLLLNLGWKDVDAANDYHVVRSPPNVHSPRPSFQRLTVLPSPEFEDAMTA